jgi:DNA-binding GntR family transcriptional regulator
MLWRSRIRLVDEVAHELRERIYKGELEPGTPLRQEQLAAELGISRTPLREALRLLEKEALVEAVPGKGVRVAVVDYDELLAAYAVREVIDGLACRLTAELGDQRIVKLLGTAIARQEAALSSMNPVAYLEQNVIFHTIQYEATGNPYLISQTPLLRMTATQIHLPIPIVSKERVDRAVTQHRAILDAIASRDAERAEQLARSHIRDTADSIQRSALAADARAPHGRRAAQLRGGR